jgi:hypothetical protein
LDIIRRRGYFQDMSREPTLLRFIGRLGIILVSGLFVLTGSLAGASAPQAASGRLPVSVDNSRTKYFPPAAYQGKPGSCDWFACAYYQMTYMNNRALDRAADPTNIFSPKFGFTLVNNGEQFPENLWFMDVYDLLLAFGSPSIADLPYDLAGGAHCDEWCTNAGLWGKAASWRIAGYEFILFDLTRVKKLLADGEVLVLQCNPWQCRLETAKDYPGSKDDDEFVGESIIASGAPSPDHTIALVGYNDAIWIDRNGNGKADADELGAFKLAESASGAGEKDGHRWVSYGAAASVLFENKVWRIKIRDSYKPRVLVQVTLNSPERGRLKMQFGRSADPDPALFPGSEFKFNPPALGFLPGRSGRSLIAGADVSFSGVPGPGNGSFVFDLTDLVTGKADSSDFWFFRLRNDSTKKVRILSYKIIDAEKGVVTEDRKLPAAFSAGERTRVVRYHRTDQ